MASDEPGLLALGAELVEVRRPVRATGGVRGAGAVPAAHTGDRLLAVLVLVDDVPERLRLTGAVDRTGQGQGTTVQGWAPGHVRRISGLWRRAQQYRRFRDSLLPGGVDHRTRPGLRMPSGSSAVLIA